MRILLHLLLALLAGLRCPLAAADDSGPTGARLEPRTTAIRVVEGDWGRAHPGDIEAVLRSAADALSTHVADRPPLAIVVVPAAGHPRVLHQKTASGEYVVGLSARDRRWSQYAYQFAHELCHVLANFDHRVSAGGVPLSQHQWFEETLCETASLFALRRMAVTWASSPPFPHWKSYAPWLDEYADLMLGSEHRQGAEHTRLGAWFAANTAALARDPYAREHNELCAAALLPLFEADPEQWATLRYLNRDGAAAASTFRDYVRRWQLSAPTAHRAFIGEIVAAFGFADAIARR